MKTVKIYVTDPDGILLDEIEFGVPNDEDTLSILVGERPLAVAELSIGMGNFGKTVSVK